MALVDLEELRQVLDRATRRVLPASMAAHHDDIVQLGWMKAVKAVESGQSVNRSWLARVAYTTMVDELRRLRIGREERVEGEMVEQAVEAPRLDGPEERAASSELGRALELCMGKLAPRSSRGIQLFLAGYPAAEVAAVLKITAKAAHHLVSRSRSALRDCLTKQGVAPGGTHG